MGLFDTANARLADIEARLTALEGGTVEPPVTPPVETISPITWRSGDVTENKRWTAPACNWVTTGNEIMAITGSGIQTATGRNLMFENIGCGAKIGSGSQSRNLLFEDVQSRGCFGAFFFANVSDSTFRNLDLECVYIPNAQSGYKNHVIYLERGNHNLSFYDVKSTGGSSWPIHLYNYETTSQPSTDILFDGLEVDCQVGAIVISEGYQRVTIKNLKATSGGGFPVIQLYGAAKDIVIDGFECWGGSALVGLASGKAAPVNVTLRNGIYHGPALPMLPGVTYENVRVVG